MPFLNGHKTEISELKKEMMNRIAEWRKLDYAKIANDMMDKAKNTKMKFDL